MLRALERQKRTGNGPASQEGAGCQKSFFRRRIDQYRRQPSAATPRRPNTALRETLASFWLYSPQIPMSAATACGQVSRSSRRGRLCAAAYQAVVESANRGTGGRLGLTVNEAKTLLRNARQECFTFLGYSFGPHWYKANGHRYLGASPSKKSVQRLKTTVGNLLVPGNNAPWQKVRDTLNRALRGWSNYFRYGTRRSAFRSVDRYTYERVRDFLARRHKVAGRGTRRFSCEVVYAGLGVLRLERLP